MFVADSTDGLQEWIFNGSTWLNPTTLSGSFVGLTGIQSGNTVTLYATTGTSAAAGWVADNSLDKVVFTYASGTSGSGTFGSLTNLATATGNSAFAGVAFAPQAIATPEPATGLLALLGLIGVACSTVGVDGELPKPDWFWRMLDLEKGADSLTVRSFSFSIL